MQKWHNFGVDTGATRTCRAGHTATRWTEREMKNNKWPIVRLGFIIASALIYALRGPLTDHASPPIDTTALIVGFIFGIIGLQFILAIQFKNKNSAEIWETPSWSKNPFQMKQPIHCFHLGAWLFISSSLITSLLTWFKSPQYLLDALMPLVIGIGLLIGVHLSRLLFKRKFQRAI